MSRAFAIFPIEDGLTDCPDKILLNVVLDKLAFLYTSIDVIHFFAISILIISVRAFTSSPLSELFCSYTTIAELISSVKGKLVLFCSVQII